MTTTTTVSGENTPFWDIIPGAAQLKSVFQLIAGDPVGAVKTQKNFLNEGLGPSQGRSIFYCLTGEPKKGLNVQGKFFSNLEGVVDSTPLIGHIKGGIHLLAGDHDHGISAIKSATSTTGTILGGALLGPIGAIGGHLLTDAAITVTDFAINGNKAEPHGVLEYIRNFGVKNAGEHFDTLASLAVDGFTGLKSKTTANLLSKQKSILSHYSHSRMRELSKQFAYKALKQAEAEAEMDSVLQEHQGTSEWLDDANDPEVIELTELRGNPVERVLESPDTGKSSPVIRLASPETLGEVESIGEETPSIESKRDLTKLPDARVLKSIEDNEELRTDFKYYNDERMKAQTYMKFLKNDPAYVDYGFDKMTFKKLRKHTFRGLEKYAQRNEINSLDVDALTNKLRYLTDEEKSLIIKYDFRTVNTDLVKSDSILTALAGIIREDVKTLKSRLLKKPKRPYHPVLDSPPKTYFKELTKRNNIDFFFSQSLVGLKELNKFLVDNAVFLEGKKLIMVETAGLEEGNAFVLKMKMIKDNPNPVKLLINYQVPGFLKKGLPNPFRFVPFVEDPHVCFKIYVIGVTKNKFID